MARQIPQSLQELIDDTLVANGLAPMIPGKPDAMGRAMIAAFDLGYSDHEEQSIQENELIMETMQAVADKRHFNAGDLMAFLFLVNEYEGTDSQTNDGRIFTTINLAAVGPKLDNYECAKFYLPNGDVEFQVLKKGGKPAPAATLEIDP